MKVNNVLLIITVFLLFISSCQNNASEFNLKPNIVFFLIDDLGWTDLGCYGSTFYETPNIDQLASEGMLFSDAYSSCPVCSPSRASIMTGKHPARLNITDWIPGNDPNDKLLLGTQDNHELGLSERTIAEYLGEEDYKTGFIGKWHLGDEGYYPEDQGFDLNKGGHDAGQPATYFYPYTNDHEKWDVPGTSGGSDGEYLTDRHTSDAVSFITTNKKTPFFLMLSHYAVHTPIESRPELENKYEAKKGLLPDLNIPSKIEGIAQSKMRQDNPTYAGMIESVDHSVGVIMEELKQLNLLENTIIVFTSDNGGLSTLIDRDGPTSTLPLRAGKGWLYEGGIRIPLIIKWDDHIKSLSRTDIPVMNTDLFPTLLEMTGIWDDDLEIDGHSLASILDGSNGINQNEIDEALFDRSLYWHFPHYHGAGTTPSAAIRNGEYKLIYWYENDEIELFSLKSDIGEHDDIKNSIPKKALELKNELNRWQLDIGALHPTKNPNFDKK